jgi:hypothetical protein
VIKGGRLVVGAVGAVAIFAGCGSFHAPQGTLWTAPVGRLAGGTATLEVDCADLAGMSELRHIFLAIDGNVVFRATSDQLWARGRTGTTPLGTFALAPGRHVVRVGIYRVGGYYLGEYGAQLEDQRAMDLPEGRSSLLVRIFDRPSVDEPGHGLALEFRSGGAEVLATAGDVPLRLINTQISDTTPRPDYRRAQPLSVRFTGWR